MNIKQNWVNNICYNEYPSKILSYRSSHPEVFLRKPLDGCFWSYLYLVMSDRLIQVQISQFCVCVCVFLQILWKFWLWESKKKLMLPDLWYQLTLENQHLIWLFQAKQIFFKEKHYECKMMGFYYQNHSKLSQNNIS